MNITLVQKLCILCKTSTNNSLEHILPKGLFKGHIHDIFRTNNICNICNNNLGLKIDGAFLRDPLISRIRLYPDLKMLFSRFIDISKTFNRDDLKNTYLINNTTYRIDQYFLDNSYIYLISKAIERFETYMGSNPIKKKETHALIILNKNFKSETIIQYFEKAPKIIKKHLNTKNIYLGTNINLNLTINNKQATTQQIKEYYIKIGIMPLKYLNEVTQTIINPILKFFKEENKQTNRYHSQFKIDLSTYYREIAKITYLIGHNIFNETYFSDSTSHALLAVMEGKASPAMNLIMNNLENNTLKDINAKIFEPFINECTYPVLIVKISVTLLPEEVILMLFSYGVKDNPAHIFWSIITSTDKLINQFKQQYENGIYMIKHSNLEGFNTFNSFEKCLFYMDTYKYST